MDVRIASFSKIVLSVLILIGLSVPLAFSQSNDHDPEAVPDNQLPLMAPGGPPTVRTEMHRDVSPPLRDLAAIAPKPPTLLHEAPPARSIPLPPGMAGRVLAEDSVLQQAFIPATPTVNHSFEGLGQGQLGFTVTSAPPDTNGAIGSTQYVQWVNTSFAVFNKTTGALIAGPTNGNALWLGFGGGCETNNDGDPIVLYDKLANRWIFSQFSVSTTPFLQCIAVSTTSDATGTYNRYSFQYPNFDDYPKMGVWPDAYYETFNMFNGNNFVGSDACAYNRNAMLNGQPATQICFQQNSSVGGLLPSDLDGTTAPPAGSPNFMVFFGNNNLNLFRFHVDFASPNNSTFSGPVTIPVAAFSPLCGGGTCVTQPGTSNQLDSLADRLMYRLAYRNFGSHQSLVVNHSVATSSSGGVRWYEIQNPGGTPTLAQQGTFAPDSSFRWMGSVAMDQAGDIAVGYSVSSSSVHPSIAFAGRVPSDPSGTLEAETNIVTGAGSQTGTLHRWGDYSAMTVDPVDDCTFWYTDEYIKTNGSFNWNTRIANFKFPNCGTTNQPDFTLSESGSPKTVTAGGSTTFTATVAPLNGFTGNVSLSLSGLPSGASGSFSPNPITSGSGSSTLTVSTSTTTPPGTYTLTITGTSGGTSHTTTVTLTVNSQSVGDFSVSAAPASRMITQGSSTTYTVTVGAINGFSGTVALSVQGLPANATSSFNPASITASGTSTLTISTATSTPIGTSHLTIVGTSGGVSHSASVTLVVTSPCVTATAGSGFHDTPLLSTQTGTFTATFDATPSASPINSFVGLSHGAATTFDGFATQARFNPTGNIDARNGGGFQSASTIHYTGGLTYHFRLVINVPAHTYSIFVTPPGSAELTVGSNFAFRSTQSTVTSLTFWGAESSAGSDRVCNFTLQ